jgi:hypothetical protein
VGFDKNKAFWFTLESGHDIGLGGDIAQKKVN